MLYRQRGATGLRCHLARGLQMGEPILCHAIGAGVRGGTQRPSHPTPVGGFDIRPLLNLLTSYFLLLIPHGINHRGL